MIPPSSVEYTMRITNGGNPASLRNTTPWSLTVFQSAGGGVSSPPITTPGNRS
jgi:hypothetical protein